jgi:hypothetical protein
MLLEVKRYVADHPGCSVPELCKYFSTSVDVIKPILARLEQKSGRLLLQSGCGGCDVSCAACPLKQLRAPIDSD